MGTKCQGQAWFLPINLPLYLFIISYYLCIIQVKYQSFTNSLIHYLRHLSVVVEESESTQILSFFFRILFKWNILTAIDPDSSKKNSVQCFKLIQVILNGPTLPVGHGSGKNAWGNLPFNLEQRSIWPPGWTDSISEVKCRCKLVLLHKKSLKCIAVTLLFSDLILDLELKRYDLHP